MESKPLTTTSSAPAAAMSAGAHADPNAHAPAPSFWPIILASGIGLVFFLGFLIEAGVSFAQFLIVLAGLYTLVAAAGWANTIAIERRHMDPVQTKKDLTLGFFFFLASEAMIFEAFFEYVYMTRFGHSQWPPPGIPRLATTMPAVATLILVSSSFVLNWGVNAFHKGKKGAAKNWILLTIGMGIIFLGFQGFEWGILNHVESYTVSTGAITGAYFLMTGFHGLHVTVGLLMLSLVYWRLEKDEYNEKFHASLKSAEYYWHFVDVVWIILFFTLYLF